MINPKKLLAIARKMKKAPVERRRRKSFSTTDAAVDSSKCITSAVDKGHFVVYSIDGVRFVVPLACPDSLIFIGLFKMSEEELGLPCDGPIVLLCTGVFLDYVVSLMQRSVYKDVEKALLASIATCCCSKAALQHEGLANQRIILQGF